jgi:hypothetical protein
MRKNPVDMSQHKGQHFDAVQWNSTRRRETPDTLYRQKARIFNVRSNGTYDSHCALYG